MFCSRLNNYFTGRAEQVFSYIRGFEGNKTEAHNECESQGDVSLPTNNRENKALQSIMAENGLESIWLGEEMVRSYWHFTEGEC